MSKKISELNSISAIVGDEYIEVSQPDGSGGWQSRRYAPGTAANENRTSDNGRVPLTDYENQFSVPQKPPSYTVANLPAPAGPCRVAFASDGLKSGETTGNGTGVPVFDDGSGWYAFHTSQPVSS